MVRKIGEKTLETWKHKRKKTLIGFILVGIVVGIDYSVIFSTLYLYLKNTVKTPNTELYYGLIIAAYSVSSSLFGIIAGRWVDKTRSVKLYTNISLLLQVVGSALYIIPFHVYFPLIARFIAGAGDPFTNVCTGELVRIYDERESTRALWWLASCYSIGLIIGPVLPLIFSGIQFHLGPIIINQFNFIGIFMASLLLITTVIVNFLIYDCSKEIDLKEYLKHHCAEVQVVNDTYDTNDSVQSSSESLVITQDEDVTTVGNLDIANLLAHQEISEIVINKEAISNNNNGNDHLPAIRLTISRLMSNLDVSLLFISTFICMYSMFAVDILVPLIILVILEWHLLALVIFLICSGLVYALILFLMAKYCNSSGSLYNVMLVCIACQVFMFLDIIAIRYKVRDFPTDVLLVVLLALFWLLASCIEEVLIRAILAKMVPSDVQSFTESLRGGVSSVATIFAALTAPLVLWYCEWWALGLIVVSAFLLLAFLVRGRTLTSPKEIDFDHVVSINGLHVKPMINTESGSVWYPS